MLAARFRVGHAVPGGASALVFQGHDELADAPVALKVLPPEVRQGAYEELNALRVLAVAGVVPLIGTGMSGGQRWLAMPWIDGEAFGVPGGSGDWSHALRTFLGAVDVLGRVHRLGYIHNDVKPSNLLVGADGRVALLDLGLTTPDRIADDTLYAGTLAYASPARLQGRKACRADDFHALALMAYQAGTGRPAVSARGPAMVCREKGRWEMEGRARCLAEVPTAYHELFAYALSDAASVDERGLCERLEPHVPMPGAEALSRHAPAHGPWTRAALVALVGGDNRFEKVPTDVASLVLRRTAGAPDAVSALLHAWVRAGLGRWTVDHFEIERGDVERLRAGERPEGVLPGESPSASVPDTTQDKGLARLLMATPRAVPLRVLVRALPGPSGAASQQVGDALRAGWLQRSRAGLSLHARADFVSDARQRARACLRLAAASPRGSFARLRYLLASGCPLEVCARQLDWLVPVAAERGCSAEELGLLRELVHRALGADTVNEATASRTLLALLVCTGSSNCPRSDWQQLQAWAERMAERWPRLSAALPLCRAMAALRTASASESQHFEDLPDLPGAGWLEAPRWSAIATFDIRGSRTRRDEILAALGGESYRTCLVRRRYAYANHAFLDAAAAGRQEASYHPRSSRAVLANLSSAAALLQAQRPALARRLTARTRRLGYVRRDAAVVARTAAAMRACDYARGEHLDPDPGLIDELLKHGTPRSLVPEFLTEAAAAWRRGDPQSTNWARRALRAASSAHFIPAEALARTFSEHLLGTACDQPALELRLGACEDYPRARLQVTGLWAASHGGCPAELLTDLARQVSEARIVDTAQRLEILSVDECMKAACGEIASFV